MSSSLSDITTAAIFERYHIPKLLQQHLWRTASLMELLLTHWQGLELDKTLLLETILLHDLGNLVKFDLSETTPILLFSATELPVYRALQAEWHQKYGTAVHEVTAHFIQELKLTRGSEITALILKPTPSENPAALAAISWEEKLCHYADMRVAPQGLVTLTERFADLAQRYSNRDAGLRTPEKIMQKLTLLQTIEQELQAQVDFDLQTIQPKDLEPITRWQTYRFSVLPD